LWLERAQRSAVAQDLPDLAVLVFAERARLMDASGDARASLDAWKVALGAAEDATRPVDEAAAFLGFGALLERSAGAAVARYTCVAAAERALSEVVDVAAAASIRAQIAEARRAVVPFLADAERLRVDADLDAAIGHVLAPGPARRGLPTSRRRTTTPPNEAVRHSARRDLLLLVREGGVGARE
jgi:hypothetical protein